MVTPRKADILHKAREIAIAQQVRHGLPAITPTERELKETGVFAEAQHALMTVDADVKAQQESYVRGMAEEIGLSVLSRREIRQLKRPPKVSKKKQSQFRALRWSQRAYKHMLSVGRTRKRKPVIELPKPPKTPIVLQTTKKAPTKKTKTKKKKTTGRSGKTMRALKNVNGVKMFSFPASVWKIREPKKRRRKRR